MTTRPASSPLWHRIRVVWATLGTSATLLLVAWSAVAFRADETAQRALRSDERVRVSEFEDHWLFLPAGKVGHRAAGLLFFPGAVVDPVAYAPLAAAAAAAGYPAILVRVPLRGALGGAERPEVIVGARNLMKGLSGVKRWLVAGHSRGGEIAARFARLFPRSLEGLLLIGTSHPRDFSLAAARYRVTRLSASRDGIAAPEKLDANRHNLPATARLIVIEGGNHSQFGWYGFQPFDGIAAVPRSAQQERTIAVLLESLAEAAAPSAEDAR